MLKQSRLLYWRGALESKTISDMFIKLHLYNYVLWEGSRTFELTCSFQRTGHILCFMTHIAFVMSSFEAGLWERLLYMPTFLNYRKLARLALANNAIKLYYKIMLYIIKLANFIYMLMRFNI